MTSILHRSRPEVPHRDRGPDARSDHADAGVPTARRHSRPGWRDPRILVGVVILAGSVLLGVKVLAGADDTVGVWAARSDLPAGTALTAEEVQRVQVRFGSGDQADRYLSADQAPPTGGVLDRAVAAGEMVPRAAVGSGTDPVVEVPLAVDVDDLPATVVQGSRVDVWVTPRTATTADRLADASRVLTDVVVVQVPKAVDSLAPSGSTQVIVGVPPSLVDGSAGTLATALGRTASGRVVITRRG